mgnify:CR=1 FL=1
MHAANHGARVIKHFPGVVRIPVPQAGRIRTRSRERTARRRRRPRDVAHHQPGGRQRRHRQGAPRTRPGNAWGPRLGTIAAPTIASPAWFDQYVVAVAVRPTAPRAPHSPDKSHPGTAPEWTWPRSGAQHRLDYRPARRTRHQSPRRRRADQFKPIAGSSFAAAYVSGVAALVRAKFPQMPATSHPPAHTRPRTPRPVDVTTSSATASSTRWQR